MIKINEWYIPFMCIAMYNRRINKKKGGIVK